MLRVFSTILLFAGLVISSACSPDQSAVATISQFQSVDTTIQSRGVAVPVTFVVPVSDEPRKFPIVIMAHGHGGSREEAGGFRLVAESLAKRGVASIRIDFPGCGDSSESFTNNNLSNMLLDLQSARGFARSRTDVDNERAGLLGYSMGGRLVALLSEIDPSYKAMVTWAPASKVPVSMPAKRVLVPAISVPFASLMVKAKTGSVMVSSKLCEFLAANYASHHRPGVQADAKAQLVPLDLVLVHIIPHLQRHTCERLRVVGADARHAGSHHVTVADGFYFLQPIFIDQQIEF